MSWPPRLALFSAAVLGAGLGGCFYPPRPADCAADTDCVAGADGGPAFCAEGACHAGTGRTCPTLEPHWSSIDRNFIRLGCGVRTEAAQQGTFNCHSGAGAATSSDVDFEHLGRAALVDQSATWKGARAAGLKRVVPGDPDHSFLMIKLRPVVDQAAYGSGMPLGPPAAQPGSTCQSTLDTLAEWIRLGAKDD